MWSMRSRLGSSQPGRPEACLATYGEAVAEALEVHASEGEDVRMTPDEWRSFAAHASLSQARAQAVELGVDIEWGCERAVTPEGYYQVRGGIAYAIRSVARGGPVLGSAVDGDKDSQSR